MPRQYTAKQYFNVILPEWVESMEEAIRDGAFQTIDADVDLLVETLWQYVGVHPRVDDMIRKARELKLFPLNRRNRCVGAMCDILDQIDFWAEEVLMNE